MGVERNCMRDQISRVLGQGPVREALRELEALRLVESETYRGTRVRALASARELEEAGQVRGILEETAAQWAAAALKRNISPLRAELEAIRKAAATCDLNAYARHNMAFHRLIVEASGNALLLRVWDSLMLEVRTRIGLARHDIELTDAAETHAPIVDAFDRGDGETAGRLLREHAQVFCHGEQYGKALKVSTALATSMA